MKSLLILLLASGPFFFLSAQETPGTSLATINDAAAFLDLDGEGVFALGATGRASEGGDLGPDQFGHWMPSVPGKLRHPSGSRA
jgi:hypothetical protein